MNLKMTESDTYRNVDLMSIAETISTNDNSRIIQIDIEFLQKLSKKQEKQNALFLSICEKQDQLINRHQQFFAQISDPKFDMSLN